MTRTLLKAVNTAREFDVETSFQKGARRPGGIPREQALKNAVVMINAIKPKFADWLENELNEVARLMSAGQRDLRWVELLNQQSRRLADVAATMDSPFVSFVAHNLHIICEAVKDGAPFNAEVIQCHVDALILSKQPQYRQLRPEDLPELSDGLRRVLASRRAGLTQDHH